MAATTAYASMVTLECIAPKPVLLHLAIQTLASITELALWIIQNIGVTGIANAVEGIRESIALGRIPYVFQILAKMGAFVLFILDSITTVVSVSVIQVSIVPYRFRAAIQIHVRMVDLAYLLLVKSIVSAFQVTTESTVTDLILPATQVHANLVENAGHIGELDSTIAIAS